jgi:hypothetical protein
MANPSWFRVLAAGLLAGEQSRQDVLERAAHVLGRPWRWLGPLADRYLSAFDGKIRPRNRDVLRFLHADPGLRRARITHGPHIRVENWLLPSPPMQPMAAAAAWELPPIESTGSLAAWLGVSVQELEWLADRSGRISREGNARLGHYHYRMLAKRSGGVRLIEAPKSRLKALQRKILAEILDRVPPHAAAHGFVKDRSIRTFALPHVGHQLLLRMDLENFFPSIAAARVQAFFRTSGYPETVADLLGSLCANSAPSASWDLVPLGITASAIREARLDFARPHLPQGAPTSPALANICAWRLDCRLTALAHTTGLTYSRYADDLAFSGDAITTSSARRFAVHAAAIAQDEGFRVNHRKTRIMRQGVRQRMAGLVVNERLNIRRDEFDRLKATLTNCVRYSPTTQNREGHPDFRAHLEGRVAFVESVNPGKGSRLRRLLAEIRWRDAT